MSLSGFYRVAFAGPLPGEGGIVVIDAGTIRGSDSQFVYAGTINQGPAGITASVSVKPVQQGAINVFGTGGALTLALSGSVDGNSFSLTGSAAGLPGAINIQGQKVSDLNF